MRTLLAAAGIALLLSPLCARQKRDWQDATVMDVRQPNRGVEAAPRNPVGSVTQMGGGTPGVPTLESTGGRETWIYFIELKGRTYVAGYDYPGRKSFLGTLRAGQRVKAFADRRAVYLRDDKGREWRLRLLVK